MEPKATRPKLAVIVANGITGDSRVQKIAIAAAREGWDVTLVGRSTSTKVERSWMGPIEVLRIPVLMGMRRAVWTARQRKLRYGVTQFGLRDDAGFARYRAAHMTWVREHTAQIGWLERDGAAPLRKNTLKAYVRARRTVAKARLSAFRWERKHRTDLAKSIGNWRLDWPELQDLDLAFGPVLEELRPDVIHANDVTMIGTAARSSARLRAMGHKCAWLYDAHEYVEGIEWGDPRRQSAFPAVEAEFIGRADAVVTVSTEIAKLLKDAHRLTELPLVVANTPVREVIGVDAPRAGVRELCGLTDEQPLMVYAGWIDKQRGLETVIAGLPDVPEAHVALVTSRKNPNLDALLAQAEEAGVSDRVHVLPYVPQHAVADYLASADLGLIPFRRTPNCELSLPTKMAEYLHAGIPVIASDVKTVRAFTEEHRIGEVFTAEDPVSFAAAAHRAIANRKVLAERITEPLLVQLSWEAQSGALQQLYTTISGVAPATGRPEVPWTVEEQVQKPSLDEDGSTTSVFDRWHPLGETPIRLGLGVGNYAGQLAAFATVLSKQRSDVSCEVVMVSSNHGYGYAADHYLDSSRLGNLDLQLEQANRVLSGRYTHLIADAFKPVLGELNGDHIGADLPALSKVKLKVALLGHGSEIRHPGRHLEREQESLFHDAPADVLKSLMSQTERNLRTARESGLPIFVTTPDLLADIPWATWAPLVVDVAAWASDSPVMERKRPVVLHAPSRRWTKGSNRIIPTLEEMHESKLIDFQLLENSSWEEIRDRIKSADVVVDQFSIGSYGTFACEAMAAGRPVICHLSPEVEAATGSIPVVNATAATLRTALESLLDDPAEAARLGAASVEFARDYHDGRRTVQAFSAFLG